MLRRAFREVVVYKEEGSQMKAPRIVAHKRDAFGGVDRARAEVAGFDPHGKCYGAVTALEGSRWLQIVVRGCGCRG